jgi:signal transduction histidine kinase
LEKLATGKEKLDLNEHSIKSTILKSIDPFRQLAVNKGIKIYLNEIDDAVVVYDEDRIQQVIVNLLSNAFKFSNEINGEVKISTYVNHNKVEITIEDNGKGIKKDELNSIFNKFYQSKNQTLLKPIGSGLGLAISKQIIESHNGKIWAESSVPQGAKLTFTLPLNRN